MTAKRNQILVDALDRADFIENYASGVRRIFKDYEGYIKQPLYKISDNGVILTLYNRNYNDTQYDTQCDTQYDKESIEIIKSKIKIDKKITRKDLAKALGVSVSTIQRILNETKDICYIGSGKSGYWEINESKVDKYNYKK